MGRHIDQQWLLAIGRVQHELIHTTDSIYRQLRVRSEQINTQSSQVDGRAHYDLLQQAGNLQHQLLMASPTPSYHEQPDGSRDVSPPDDTDNGRHQVLSQQGDQPHVPPDVSPAANADDNRQGTLQGDDQAQVQPLRVHLGHRG